MCRQEKHCLKHILQCLVDLQGVVFTTCLDPTYCKREKCENPQIVKRNGQKVAFLEDWETIYTIKVVDLGRIMGVVFMTIFDAITFTGIKMLYMIILGTTIMKTLQFTSQCKIILLFPVVIRNFFLATVRSRGSNGRYSYQFNCLCYFIIIEAYHGITSMND